MPTISQAEINRLAYKQGVRPEDISSQLQSQGYTAPATVNEAGITLPGVQQTPTPTPTPTPTSQTTPQIGSVSSILGDIGAGNDFYDKYYADQLAQYNAPIDEAAIRKQKEAEFQAQIDSINAVYADKLRQEQQTSQGRLGSNRAIQARSGLFGSDFGTAQTAQVSQLNKQQEQSVENERLALVNQILSQAQSSAANEIAAKRKARDEGGKAYLDYLAGQEQRKTDKTNKAAQLLLSLGKTPQDLTDAELSQAGISRQDLSIAYQTGKSAQESAATEAELEQAKRIAEINKINADIAKGQLDASKYYEVGNRIYEQGTNRYVGDAAFNPYSGAMQVTAGNSVYNPVTGQFTQAPTTTDGATGDLRGYRSQYPNEAWSGTNNPAGISAGPDSQFVKTLQANGIQIAGYNSRPEGGAPYVVFPTIEEGMKAYNLLWQSPSYQNLTVGQALERWGTDSLPGVPTNKIVSQLTPEEFQNLQMAQIKKESPGLYKILTQEPELNKTQKTQLMSYQKQVNALPQVKDWNASSGVRNWLENARNIDLNGSDIQGLISNYAKILDPTSVVRESEYAIAQTGASQGQADKIRQQIKTVLYGGKEVLSKDAQKVLIDAMTRRVDAMRVAYEQAVIQQQAVAESVLGVPVSSKQLVGEDLGTPNVQANNQGSQITQTNTNAEYEAFLKSISK